MMQICWCVFLVLHLMSNSLYGFNNEKPPWVEPAHNVRARAAETLCNKYGLTLIGLGSAMPDGVESLSLTFQVPNELERSVARKLIVACVEDFLDIINSDLELRRYLVEYPFPPARLDVGIASFCTAKTAANTPYLSIAWTFQGNICYGYNDAESERAQFREVIREPYEDARAIVLKGQS